MEEVTIVGRWPACSLPQVARDRQGMQDHQENVALRLVMRPAMGAIARGHATAIAAQVYRGVHQGSGWAPMPGNV